MSGVTSVKASTAPAVVVKASALATLSCEIKDKGQRALYDFASQHELKGSIPLLFHCYPLTVSADSRVVRDAAVPSHQARMARPSFVGLSGHPSECPHEGSLDLVVSSDVCSVCSTTSRSIATLDGSCDSPPSGPALHSAKKTITVKLNPTRKSCGSSTLARYSPERSSQLPMSHSDPSTR